MNFEVVGGKLPREATGCRVESRTRLRLREDGGMDGCRVFVGWIRLSRRVKMHVGRICGEDRQIW